MRVKTELKAGKLLTDVVEGTSKMLGLDKLADKYTEKTGRDCGCNKRKSILDSMSPI